MKNHQPYIHHFSIMAPAEVIESTVQFYCSVLGIEPGERPPFNLPGYWLYSGKNPVIHLTAKEDRAKSNAGYLHHIAFRCHDLNETIEKLSKANIEYRRQNLDDVQQIQLTVIDPAGNLIELNFVNEHNS